MAVEPVESQAMGDEAWIFDCSGALSAAWFYDAPWVRANERWGHTHFVRCSERVARDRIEMRRVAEKDLLRQIFYGNDSSEICGLTRLFGTRDPGVAQCGANVLDGGGRGEENTSVWLLGWSPRGLYMVSPEGEPIAWSGECGLVMSDWRHAVRVANIDVRRAEADVVALMATASLRISARVTECRRMFYMNRDVANIMRDQGWPKDATQLRDIPIRVVDELRSDETAV
jgi:hypothetical protein